MGKGRHEVDGGENRIRLATRRDFARPTDDARQTIPSLVTGTLAVTQRAGRPPEDRLFGMPFLILGVLVLVPGSVIRGVDHQGILAQAQFLQGIEETARFVIEFLHHVAV